LENQKFYIIHLLPLLPLQAKAQVQFANATVQIRTTGTSSIRFILIKIRTNAKVKINRQSCARATDNRRATPLL